MLSHYSKQFCLSKGAKNLSNPSHPKMGFPVVIDFSPSEQLMGDPSRVVTMGLVVGLSHPLAIDRVGTNTEAPLVPFELGKWKGKSDTYKKKLLSHLHDLVSSGSITCGRYHAEEHAIEQIGKAYFDAIVQGELGPGTVSPIDRNKNGRGRIKIGISDIGKPETLVETKLLLDEIYVYGWITEAISQLKKTLSDKFNKIVGLDLFMDRLPLDPGTDNPIKLHFLALMVNHFCGDQVRMHTHEYGVDNLRDLLADNVAGLASETFHNSDSALSMTLAGCAPPIFGIERTLVTPPKLPN